jgi:hypothetical protein
VGGAEWVQRRAAAVGQAKQAGERLRKRAEDAAAHTVAEAQASLP